MPIAKPELVCYNKDTKEVRSNEHISNGFPTYGLGVKTIGTRSATKNKTLEGKGRAKKSYVTANI